MFVTRKIALVTLLIAGSCLQIHCGVSDLNEDSSSGKVALVLAPETGSDTPIDQNSGNNPNQTNTANLDDDGDGLTNGQEAALGTNPLVADTDGDTLTDGDEVNTHGTNPLDNNTDHDDQDDAAEVANPTTRNPLDPDDDHDGWPGTATSAGAYGPNVDVDCDNNNIAKNPGMIDVVNGQDTNCRPDKTSDTMQFFIGGGSSVHYKVDAAIDPQATGIFVHAQQITITGGVYECEYNNFNGTPITTNYSCSTWQNPPWYAGGQPLGFQVVKNSLWTWTVNACAKTCFNCQNFVFACDSTMLGE